MIVFTFREFWQITTGQICLLRKRSSLCVCVCVCVRVHMIYPDKCVWVSCIKIHGIGTTFFNPPPPILNEIYEYERGNEMYVCVESLLSVYADLKNL